MKDRLERKAAVVTGAGSGIGRAIALRFAAEGAKVAVLDISPENAAGTVRSIGENGGAAIPCICDVTDYEAYKKAVDSILKEFGKIDIAVNNTGIFRGGTVLTSSVADFDAVMSVNVKGVFLGMKLFAGAMREKGGSIINIASEAGIAAIPNQIAYNASKAAVIMMTKSSAVDLARKGIRVNCICPGRVRTALVEKILKEADDYEACLRSLSEDRPVMHMGRPEDIAAGAAYFASEESAYATGSVLSIDGGYVCP